jgi:hypothetical protein
MERIEMKKLAWIGTIIGIAFLIGVMIEGCTSQTVATRVVTPPAIQCGVSNNRKEACYPIKTVAASNGIVVTSADGHQVNFSCPAEYPHANFAPRRYFPNGDLIEETPMHGHSGQATLRQVFPQGILYCK